MGSHDQRVGCRSLRPKRGQKEDPNTFEFGQKQVCIWVSKGPVPPFLFPQALPFCNKKTNHSKENNSFKFQSFFLYKSLTVQETNSHAKGKLHAQTTMSETPSPSKTHSSPLKYHHRTARTKIRKAILLPCKPKLIQNQSSKLMNNKKKSED